MVFIFTPAACMAQIDCSQEQIDFLELELKPTFQKFSTILIECVGDTMRLNFSIYAFDKSEILFDEELVIPESAYKDFKRNVLPLEIHEIKDDLNFYLNDGLTAEVAFLD
ncbi:MAG: hypothetical protein AAF840_10560 [Bacteroidota bacterium]